MAASATRARCRERSAEVPRSWHRIAPALAGRNLLDEGRDPSDQILDSIAGALQLDDGAIAHLHGLAHPAPRPRRRTCQQPARPVPQQLLDSWPLTPAYATGTSGRVIAANQLAVVLSPFFAVVGNPLRTAFLEPGMQGLCGTCAALAETTSSGCRSSCAERVIAYSISPDVGAPQGSCPSITINSC